MKIGTTLRRAGEALTSLFFPPHCAACGADTPGGAHLCAGCAGAAKKIAAPFCQRCSEPFAGAIDGAFTCANCADRTLHFDCAVARYLSRGVVREFVHRFKYDRHFYLRHPLTDWLAETLEKGDEAALADYRARAPYAREAHPTDEHFLPLHVAYGAAGEGAQGRALHRSFTLGNLSMAAYAFG